VSGRRRQSRHVHPGAKGTGILSGLMRKSARPAQNVGQSLGSRDGVSRVYPSGMSVLYVLMMTVVIVIVCGAFIFHLSVRFEGVRLGYETSKARSLQTRLLLEQRELRLELASLKAPERVEADAREKLGMEVPDHGRIVPIDRKRKVVSVSGGAL
jgi:cell division protein FtsL